MPKIYLVRHAESIANTKGIYQGQSYDTSLSELGFIQSRALAQSIVKRDISRIICSPLKRTFYTALESAKKTKAPIEASLDIIETNHGKWEGMHKNMIIKNYPETYETWLLNPELANFPEGEEFSHTIKRVNKFLLTTKWRENTLVVTHDNIVRIIIALIEGSPINNIWSYQIDPTGITTISVVGTNGSTRMKVLNCNDTSHLAGINSNLAIHAL